MNAIEGTIAELEAKIERLVDKYKKSEEDRNDLQKKLDAIQDSYGKQEKALEEIKAKNTLIKLAKSLDNNEKYSDVKLKINQLVREIDRCIALLSK